MTFRRRDLKSTGKLGLILLGLGAYASTILAQTPGTFTATGNMTTPRSGHTATLLTNGKVLIVGADAGADLYDPGTGTFSETGDRIAPGAHSATLLPNGKVLIAGSGLRGTDGRYSSLAHAELYDPDAGTFAATGDMTVEREGGTATLLNNGKVLIAGGAVQVGDVFRFLASAELYDLSTGTFTATGDMTAARFGPTATLLANGKVLIDGGRADNGDTVSGAEVYDPDAGTFNPAPGMTSNPIAGSVAATATLLTNGRILATLEYSEDVSNLADLYDPSTGIFTATRNMTATRRDRTATLLPDGTVLIAGGGDSALPPGWFSVDRMAGAELYDPAVGTFSPTGAMATGREFQTATLLPDGTVLMSGGWSYGVGSTASAEIYHPALLAPSPVLLSLSGDGRGQGAIQHAGTTRIASADDPAVAGEYLSMYLNGLTDGSLIPPQVAIGGRSAEITFFGNVPGYPGLNVVNIRMPSGVAPGPAVPVRLTYLSRSSNQVTIGVALDGVLQKAVTAMKAAAGINSLNFWQWAYYWQYLPAFSGAPAGFGVCGSISPDVMARITAAGGGDPLRNVSAEQWVSYFRQVVPQ